MCHTGFLTYNTIAVRTVKNPWWWTEELSESFIPKINLRN